jgi:hypothetical protein
MYIRITNIIIRHILNQLHNNLIFPILEEEQQQKKAKQSSAATAAS